jgi:hypothetical protein
MELRVDSGMAGMRLIVPRTGIGSDYDHVPGSGIAHLCFSPGAVMPLPRAVPVTLTAAERTTLKKRARGAKTAHRDRLRAGRADRSAPLRAAAADQRADPGCGRRAGLLAARRDRGSRCHAGPGRNCWPRSPGSGSTVSCRYPRCCGSWPSTRSSLGSTGPGSPLAPRTSPPGGRDLGPVPGVSGHAAAAGRPDLVSRRQAVHPGPRPLPSHRPGRARHAGAGRARIRPPRRPGPRTPDIGR